MGKDKPDVPDAAALFLHSVTQPSASIQNSLAAETSPALDVLNQKSDEVLPYLEKMGFVFAPGSYEPDNASLHGKIGSVSLFVRQPDPDLPQFRCFELFFRRQDLTVDLPRSRHLSIVVHDSGFSTETTDDSIDDTFARYSDHTDIISRSLTPLYTGYFPENAQKFLMNNLQDRRFQSGMDFKI